MSHAMRRYFGVIVAIAVAIMAANHGHHRAAPQSTTLGANGQAASP